MLVETAKELPSQISRAWWESFEISSLPLSEHTSSNKGIPPNPSQTLPPTKEQVFNYMILVEAILIQTTAGGRPGVQWS